MGACYRCGAESAEIITADGFASSHEVVAAVAIGEVWVVGTAGLITSRVAARVTQLAGRVSAGEGGRSLAVGHGSVAPATVAVVVILGHFRGTISGDDRKGGIVVGIVAVLLDFLSAFLLCVLVLLALPPQEQTGEDEKGDNDDGDNDSDGRLAGGGETAAVAGAFVAGGAVEGCGRR